MAVFYNTATLSYNDKITNSNVVTGEIVDVISATKTVINGSYNGGDTLTYAISIINSGSSSVGPVTVTDNLGAYTFGNETLVPLSYVNGSIRFYSNGAITTAPAVTDGDELVITGITVPAQGNVLILYEAEVNGAAPLEAGSTITNAATITGVATPIVVTETITTNDEPMLTISKGVSPETVVDDSELTYTFVIQNSGNTAAVSTDNVTVTDVFDPVLTDITVTLNSVPLNETTGYTYNSSTGEFATVPGVITVPAANYTQDNEGRWVVTPGVSVLRVTGTI